MRIYTEKAKDGHIVPIMNNNGLNTHLGSMYDGKLASKVWMDNKLSARPIVDFAMIGMGDLEIVMRACEVFRERILVYEPCKEIYDQMKTTALYKKVIRNPIVHITTDPDEFLNMINECFNDDIIDQTEIFVHPGYENGQWDEVIDKIQTILKDSIDELVRTKYLLMETAEKVINNELRSVPLMKNGILLSRLFDKWDRDVPIIIVGAGPSLKKNVQELKRVGNRACILCMDSAYPVLKEYGIEPDLFATIDASKFINLVGDPADISAPVLVTSNTRTEYVSDTPGVKIWCYEAHSFANYIRSLIETEPPMVPTEYGVSSLSIAFAVELGIKNIIFVGMDMAFSKSGESHSGLTKSTYLTDEKYEVDGYYGDKVYSRYDWKQMQGWIEEIIEEIPFCRYINATEGGVRIAGTIQKSLSDAIDELAEPDNDWISVLDDEKVHISDDEYKKMLKVFYDELDGIDGFSLLSLEDVFFDPYFNRPKFFDLFRIALRAQPEETREERFSGAMKMLTEMINEVRDEKNLWL